MATLHYQLAGPDDAPVVVLSNSLGTTLEMWEPQMQALTQQFRVLRYDARGHGRSALLPPPYSIDDLGNDVVVLLDKLGIERADFVGISMGGLIGQWLAIHKPERIGKLIVSNTAARIGTADGWRARAELVRAQGLAEVAGSSPARWFTPRFAAEQVARVEPLVERLRTLSPEGYAACCDVLGATDLRDAIGKITAPTLVIAGEHDPVTTVADARFIVRQVAGATLATLPASHLSNIEVPEAFNEAVLSFLAG
ncbi:3-oxoadipate enol-lactonase [Trinickia caryophylli]|uniref:3-oxoadipate enol-lactonase n=1 Tax=Trinickia caryophylli TaxID=28094 RepID=A0A1X7CUG4_TRICW|nr:3-oxoadipate enol-lactonase [Trinickia caryophylli]PMS13376.1 3-oxoadipate enol-lactonase [Trinickia caryophylli]TRX13765.1 3-oxoadipate enol-lactonase [Trinickia caryophylli]WQE15358.1 3-oxoadipate enol-lactonase [Trinickia caryophylli]SMF03058.1 3-oxoadipate enol-lactonase [Trinickia caryophylli]GLU30881.1 3-oxoadipate enol-lactonase [Trinickia caryophylli]